MSSTASKTIKLPVDLYRRLQARAEAEQTDAITLIDRLLQSMTQKELKDASTAPIYQVHQFAEDMEVTDLAQNLDHYLYGLNYETNGFLTSTP